MCCAQISSSQQGFNENVSILAALKRVVNISNLLMETFLHGDSKLIIHQMLIQLQKIFKWNLLKWRGLPDFFFSTSESSIPEHFQRPQLFRVIKVVGLMSSSEWGETSSPSSFCTFTWDLICILTIVDFAILCINKSLLIFPVKISQNSFKTVQKF